MLKKLLKHEWAETWKVPTLIIGVTLLVTVALAIYYKFEEIAPPEVELNMGNLVIFIFSTLLFSSAILLLTIYFAIRFYKNLYTDEGYLMHTLPVRPWELLSSKAVIAGFWSYIGGLIITLTLLPVLILAIPRIGYVDPDEYRLIYHTLFAAFGGSPLMIFLFIGPCMMIGSISSILTIYASVSMGQLFPGHKVLASILSYLGLNSIISSVSAMIMIPGMTGVIITHSTPVDDFFEQTMAPVIQSTLLFSSVAGVIIAAAAFFLCKYIMDKCLNLD